MNSHQPQCHHEEHVIALHESLPSSAPLPLSLCVCNMYSCYWRLWGVYNQMDEFKELLCCMEHAAPWRSYWWPCGYIDCIWTASQMCPLYCSVTEPGWREAQLQHAAFRPAAVQMQTPDFLRNNWSSVFARYLDNWCLLYNPKTMTLRNHSHHMGIHTYVSTQTRVYLRGYATIHCNGTH